MIEITYRMSLKRSLKKYLKQGFILISILLISSSCDVCDSSCCGESKSTIYFSAKTMTSKTSNVFSLSDDFDQVDQLVENAKIYSTPSIAGDIVYLQEGVNNNKIVLYNIKSKQTEDLSTLFGKKADKMIISSDGNTVLYIVSETMLQSRIGRTLLIDNITSKFAKNTMPTFSPDGKKIAFWKEDGNLTLHVKTVSHNWNDDYTKSFGSRGQYNALLGDISWSDDGKEIIYSLNTGTSEKIKGTIHIYNLATKQEKVISVDQLGGFEPRLHSINKDILFVDAEGNLWKANYSKSTIKYEKLIDMPENIYCKKPLWSADRKKVLYFREIKGGSSKFLPLYLYDFESKLSVLINNNAETAYWSR